MATQKPVDYALIRKTLANAVKQFTGCQSILEEQKGQLGQAQPRPALPYFSFKITTPGARFGDDQAAYIENEGNENTIWNRGGQRQMSVSFHCYAKEQEEAYDLMALLQARLDTEEMQAVLRRAGIAVWIIGTVADLSQLLNTGYEGRAQLDGQFGIASNITEDMGAIEHAEITGTVHTDSGDKEISFTAPPEEEI